MKVEHIGIAVADVDKACAYYRSLFFSGSGVTGKNP